MSAFDPKRTFVKLGPNELQVVYQGGWLMRMLTLLNKIPSHWPKAWVTAVLLWCVGVIVMGAAALCSLVGWDFGFTLAFGAMFLIVVSFMGCAVWLMVEMVLRRITPWRR